MQILEEYNEIMGRLHGQHNFQGRRWIHLLESQVACRRNFGAYIPEHLQYLKPKQDDSTVDPFVMREGSSKDHKVRRNLEDMEVVEFKG